MLENLRFCRRNVGDGRFVQRWCAAADLVADEGEGEGEGEGSVGAEGMEGWHLAASSSSAARLEDDVWAQEALVPGPGPSDVQAAPTLHKRMREQCSKHGGGHVGGVLRQDGRTHR